MTDGVCVRYVCMISGRLPFTIAKNESDYSARVTYQGSGIVQIPYSEGIFIDYRHFDQVRCNSIRGMLVKWFSQYIS